MNYAWPSAFSSLALGTTLGLACLVLATAAPAQEWTRFRGPNGSGVSAARSVPTNWGEHDYNWKIELPGVGHASPVVWERTIFLTSGDEQSGARIALAVDAGQGRILWSHRFEAAPYNKHKLNSFASATPAVDEQHVYFCWATPEEYLVVALRHDGQEAWRVDLGPFRAGHGFGVSPIVDGELVIVPNEQEGQSALVALERASGAIRWRVTRDSKVTYSTPCLFESSGGPAQLIFTNYEHGITALDPQSGRKLWEIDVFDKSHLEMAIGSPVIAGDLVLGVCGWLGHGNEVIAVRPDMRDGTSSVKQVYRIDRGAPLCTTPVVKGGLLFLWADSGIVTCADAASGENFWRKRVGGTFYASPVCVGDHLYNISADGQAVVLAADKEFELVARVELGEPSHSTPAVADGIMYLRTFGHLMSLGREN